jgi:3-hydroxyisobutyrate dehydrogenase-like beta-hydroxyacid dehydrogenase
MCLNLCKAGFLLTINDQRRETAEDVLEAGAVWAGSCLDVAAASDVVITMLPSTTAVEDVVLGPKGVLAGARSGMVVVDMSTSAPGTSKRLEAACLQRGIAFVDAPVSGGVQGAKRGTLTIMDGGDEATMARLRPVFAALGAPDHFVHAGPVGNGEIVKLINQHLLGVIAAAPLEAFVLSVKAGVAVEIMDRVLSTSSGGSWQLAHAIRQRAFTGSFEPGFTTDLLVKDLRLVQDLADDLHVPLTMVAVARQMYEAARAQGYGSNDSTAVVRPLEQLVGVEARFRATGRGGGTLCRWTAHC